METGLGKKVKIRIAQEIDSKSYPNFDTHDLVAAQAAEVRKLNFTRLIGSGILHTKLWVVDRKHVYLGSANLDWRSLTQVKELGLFITNCSCFAHDIQKIFDVYWELGHNNSRIPDSWPTPFHTDYGKDTPMKVAFNGTQYNSYISSSPPQFCPSGRTTDIDSILDVMDNATEFIHVSVMDYTPSSLYTRQPVYWPDIDDRLKSAAIDRRVKIRLLISKWNNTRESQYIYLKSLHDLNHIYNYVDIQIKLFEVPSTPDQAKIPFARVNHNKYMVTDKSAYVGTSNWSSDYFTVTGGVGIIITPRNRNSSAIHPPEDNAHAQIKAIFDRDWNSSYAKPLEEVMAEMQKAGKRI
jgi:phospholipase D3/4